MTSAVAQEHEARRARRTPRPARQVGYVVGAAVNAVMLWIAYQLLDWEWPRFLTEDFDELLPWITVSLAVSIGFNLVYVMRDTRRVKALGDLVTAVIGFVVMVRTWQVFPFDFSTYAHDWSWLLRTIIVIALIGTAAGAIASAVKLATPSQEPGTRGVASPA